MQIQRTRTIKGKKSVELVYLISDMTMAHAQPVEIAAWVRGHWGIENRLHHVRDATYPTLRNLALGMQRAAGLLNIAEACRHYQHYLQDAIKLVLTSGKASLTNDDSQRCTTRDSRRHHPWPAAGADAGSVPPPGRHDR